MTRKLKVLGLALVAVCAMSAVVAASASAVEFKSTKGTTVTLTGAQHNGEHKFTVGFGTVNCTKAKFHSELTTPNSVATVTAEYGKPAGGECVFAGIPAEVHMNECDFTLFANGNAAVDCPAGKEITVTAVQAGVTKCVVHVPAQTGLTGVTYTNVGAGETEEVTMHLDITGQIKYSQTEGTGLGRCPTLDGATNGSYHGTATITGEETISPFNHIGITVS